MNDAGQGSAKRRVKMQLRVVEAILRRWDPLQVLPDDHGPHDEYDSYAPRIVGLIARGCTIEALAGYLAELRTGVFNMRPDPESDHAVATKLLAALRK